MSIAEAAPTEAKPAAAPKKLTKKEIAAAAKAEAAANGKGQKKRVKKDKNAPKKPMSPFFCYQAKRRPEIKAATPDISNNAIISVSGTDLNFAVIICRERYAPLSIGMCQMFTLVVPV